MYTNTKQIRANVKTNWSHPNCKFQRGDRVVVNELVLRCPTGYGRAGAESGLQRDRAGTEGHVVAVSCTPDGRIRGKAPNGYCERMYSRYYVQFADKVIHGLHSHFLTAVE